MTNDENQGPDMTSETKKMDILSDEVLCKAIAVIVPEATFESQDKAGTQPMPEMADRLDAIEMILKNACVLYGGDKEAARCFLLRKHLLLHNRSPLEIILKNPLCADEVAELLLRAGSGFAV
ncbi:hypothetical protein [Halocynthiibacter namhaensis]|uniref:hypothetical protein n=1 Tax=Halocynthiibacter namhaensis TaxID=1290553 RepID=UPI0005796BA2|nr:hypothetical protein [Halocynthiibacter namhaensis]